MMREPTTLTDAEREQIEQHMYEYREFINQQVTEILNDIDSPSVRDRLRSVVFTPNAILPKRDTRPSYKIAHLADQLYLSHSRNHSQRETFARFTVATMEYFDIVDDIIDGDVAEGAEFEVYLTNEFLNPIVVRFLSHLGEDAVAYWSDHTVSMLHWFEKEFEREPSKDAYLDIVEKQSELFGMITGMSVFIAGEGPLSIEEAERIGKLYFKYDQFLLDREQLDSTDSDPWNAWKLMPESETTDYVRRWQNDVATLTERLPQERAELIRPFHSLHICEWREQFTN